MCAASKRGYVQRANRSATQHWFKVRMLLQLLLKNLIDGKSLLTFSLGRRACSHVSHAYRAGVDRNLPYPVEVLRRPWIHVECGSFHGLFFGEVCPQSDFGRSKLDHGQIEFASQHGRCKSGGIDEPLGCEGRAAGGFNRNNLVSIPLNADNFIADDLDALRDRYIQY